MTFTDKRSNNQQGDLPLQALEAIMNNSKFALPFSDWNRNNFNITITKGAHQGTYYPDLKSSYYFDISVNGSAELHCVIPNPSDKNSNVLAVK